MNTKIIIERLKSPVVWIGIGALIISASGVEPQTLTSWGILWENILKFLSNPFMVASAGLAIFSFLNNPSDKEQF
jgi:phi LC3 family holin